MESLIVAGVTEVTIGRGLPGSILPERDHRVRAALLTQPGADRHALEVARLIELQGAEVEVIELPDRDEAKTLEVARSVYEALARFGLSRHDTIVGVGGGSVTDLSGYVAGTWLRGVESVYVPTTLLAAVDASIGGKTGVNLGGKNLIGVFWHPSRVVIDLSILELRLAIMEWMERLDIDPSFADRYLNDGFSGGEKKRNEALQMAVLEPAFAVLDETDSGLDIDALKIVADGVNALRSPDRSMLIITHYQRLLDYVVPDRVHVLSGGRIVKSGGKELAIELEKTGYTWIDQGKAGVEAVGS